MGRATGSGKARQNTQVLVTMDIVNTFSLKEMGESVLSVFGSYVRVTV